MAKYLYAMHTLTVVTASDTVLGDTIDISRYDRFYMQVKNEMSACALNFTAQVAAGPLQGTAGALVFEDMPTSVFAIASGINDSGQDFTSGIQNYYKYLRIVAHTTATAGVLRLHVGIGGKSIEA